MTPEAPPSESPPSPPSPTPHRRFASLGARLALLHVSVLALALTGLGLVMGERIERALWLGVEGILADELAEVAEPLMARRLTLTELRALAAEEAAEHEEEGLAIRIVGASGAVLAETASPIWAFGELDAASMSANDAGSTITHPALGERYRIIRMRRPTLSFGPVTMWIGMRAGAVDPAIAALRRDALVVGPSVLLGIVLLGYLLSRQALRPIRAIEAAARRIGTEPSRERMPLTGTGDELDRLAATLNAMLERLEAASARNIQFVGDVAHELRTPLATVRARLEDAATRFGGSDAGPQLEEALREVRRIEGLLRSLLLINRVDDGGAELVRTLTDLADVAREVVAFFEPVAAARGLALRLEATAAPCRGDALLLQRAAANLVDNALHYTDVGAEVVVRTALRGDRAVFEVEDGGRGVEAADRARLFERFARSSSARLRNPEGSGLGLALTRAVARAHGGNASYTARAAGGSLFALELPAGGPSP